MDEVTEIFFDDVSIPVGGVVVGFFSGTAGIDQEGSVCSLILDGYQSNASNMHADKRHVRIEVPHPQSYSKSWDQTLAELIARQIEAVYADSISDAINDWRSDVEAA